jgi:Hpt domain
MFPVDSPEPLLDHRLADQWFADSNAEDQVFDRTMVSTLRKDVGPRIARLREIIDKVSADKAKAELHSLRGAVSSIGLLACGQHLRELEKQWAEWTAAERVALLTAAEDNFNSGMEALFQRFPHLREPAS